MSESRSVRLPAAERRQQIIESARQVYITHGLAGAGTRQLADAAGVNSALIYHYFPTKEALFDAAVIDPLRTMIQELIDITVRIPTEDPTTQDESTEAGIAIMLRSVQEILPLLGIVLFSDAERSRAFYIENLAPLLETDFLEGRSSLSGWETPPIERWMLIAIFGMCFGLAMDQHFRDVAPDDGELARKLTEFVHAGLTADVRPEAPAPSRRRAHGGP